MIENFWANAAYSLIPTILLGLIFWLVMRSIFRADRTERTVYAEIEAEERARFATEDAAVASAAVLSAAAVNAAPTSDSAENAAGAGSTAAASRKPIA
ncbi:MAG: hypothetical protein H7279_03630 [Microbacteriaceae bacterium]|nr:hypothetical protein [Microbacteriaceae bacterium]